MQIYSLGAIVAAIVIFIVGGIILVEGFKRAFVETGQWLPLLLFIAVALSAGTYYAAAELHIPIPLYSALWFSMWASVWCAGAALVTTLFYFVMMFLPRRIQFEGVTLGVFSSMSITFGVFFFAWTVRLYGLAIFLP